jgi:hypothetical protein
MSQKASKKLHSVRFELTRDSIPLELESNALDRSATNAVIQNGIFLFESGQGYLHPSLSS